MVPPKKPEEKSSNPYTVKERARREKLKGFDRLLDKSKRTLKQAETDTRNKVRKSLGFNILSPKEQAS